MAQSIKEQIVDNIISTIEGVTVSAGYNQTLIYVTRQETKIFGNNSWPCAMVRIEADDVDDTVTVGYYHHRMTVDVLAYTADNVDPQQALSYLAGDIHKAMLVDYTRGSLVIDTRVDNIDYDYAEEGEDPTGTVTISFNVHYRTLVEDPFSSG